MTSFVTRERAERTAAAFRRAGLAAAACDHAVTVIFPPRPPAFPFPVPLRQVPGLVNAPEGHEEGDLCGRTYPGLTFCLGKLELRRDEGLGGCSCFASAPCSSCMSSVPERPGCGHREPEPC